MLLIHDNVLDEALLGAESEYSDTFPVENVIDRKSSKRYRSYRAPNLMLYGNCDSANSPTLDGTPVACVNGTWTRDEDMKSEGVSSWCLLKTSAAGGGDAYQDLQDGVSTSDLHGLSVGNTYEFICKLRTSAATPTRAAIYIYQRYGGTWNSTATQTCLVSNTWEQKRIYTTIFSGTTGIIVRVYLYTDAMQYAKLWIDKIRFFVKNDYITNGKCEFTDSPTLDGGTTGLTNGTWAQSAAQKHSGTYSWQLNKTTAGGAGSAYVYLTDNLTNTDMHGLTAGKTYYIDLWMFLSGLSTPGNGKIEIQEYYSATWNVTTIGVGLANGVWENKTKIITINPATTGITIRIITNTAEPVNSKIYLDDIQFILETRLTFDLYSAQAPEFAAFIGDNLSASATAYFQANTADSWTSPAVSEVITKNTTTGLWLLELTNSTAYRYWSLVIYDFDYNEDGYVEVGYAHLGAADRYNGIDVEFAERPVPKDTDQESDSGETTGTDGAFLLEWDIGIPDCYLATKTQLDAMIRATRKHTPFIWVADENNLAKFPARYVKWTAFDFEHIGGFELYSFKGSVKETV